MFHLKVLGAICLASSISQSVANASTRSEVSLFIGLADFQDVLASFRDDSALAVFEFSCSEAGSIADSTGRQEFRLKGELSLNMRVCGIAPPKAAKKVDHPLPINSVLDRGKYRPFLRLSADIRTLYVIAFWSDSKKNDFLDARFFGPLLPGDLTAVQQFKEFLEKKPIADLGEKDALALLSSTNPLLIYLGLSRLDALDVGSSTSYFLAVESLPPVFTKDALDYFFKSRRDAGEGKESAEKITAGLIKLFRKLEPMKQEECLKSINWFVRTSVVSNVLSLPQLQTALRDAREGAPEGVRRESTHS